MAFDLVPDEKADLADGLLGLGTPLAQAIKGQTAGRAVLYNQGDIREVRILKVAYSRRDLEAANSAEETTGGAAKSGQPVRPGRGGPVCLHGQPEMGRL